MKDTLLTLIYNTLFSWYGKQGWFPLLDLHDSDGVNPTKTGSVNGYHPGDYAYPKTRQQQFEICVGCILTQNTAWPNVEQALLQMKREDLLDPDMVLAVSLDTLKQTIRPAGYFNQKAEYLLAFTRFFNALDGRIPSRDEVLSIKGIGNETADAILLYAFKQLEFVVDTYCRRIFGNLGLVSAKEDYMTIKEKIESSLPRDVAIYQEFHALLVEHAKRYYRKGTVSSGDPLCSLV